MNEPIMPFRDYAAIQITAAMASNFMPGSEYDRSQVTDLTKMAYEIADALHKERGVDSASRYGRKKK